MKIAIIGAGNVGTALAGALARAGHRRHHQRARSGRTRRRPRRRPGRARPNSNKEALAAGRRHPRGPGTAFDGVVNRDRGAIRRQARRRRLQPPTPDAVRRRHLGIAEDLQALLPERSIVKAFNTVFAIQPGRSSRRTASRGRLRGRRRRRREGKVLELVASIGFRPVDAGPLARRAYPRGHRVAEHQPQHAKAARGRTPGSLPRPRPAGADAR